MDSKSIVDVIILAGGKKRLEVSKRARRGVWYWPMRALHWLLLRFLKVMTGVGGSDDTKLLPDEVQGWDIRVGKERCIDRICAVLRDCPGIGEVILVANAMSDDFHSTPLDRIVPAGDTIGASLCSGARNLTCKEPRLLLVVCGDLPFLSAKSVRDFIDRCCLWRADVFLSYVTKACSLKRYPDLAHTWAMLWDDRAGEYLHACAGGLVMIHAEDIEKVASKLDAFYELRNNVPALAWEIGPFVLVRYLLGWLSIDQLRQRLRKLFGVDFQGICMPDAALAFNIDDRDGLLLAERYLTHVS